MDKESFDESISIGVRSTDPLDYQNVPRPVAAMSKSFEAGYTVEPHDHVRDQVLYAIDGVMRITTASEAWIVPPDRALFLPRNVEHSVVMKGRVEMRTLFIQPGSSEGLPEQPAVLDISPLLKSLILALLDEPILYDETGRGGLVAGLILDELARAQRLQLVIPMPRDERLKRLCQALVDDPSRAETLDRWADQVGASPRTLSRLFTKEVSLTFVQWRQRVRFHNALESIVRGDAVGKVARDNGYESASAFTAAFRNVMGVTPSSLSRN